MGKPTFLQQVRASHFARKENYLPENWVGEASCLRKVGHAVNPKPEQIYTVIGTTWLHTGRIYDDPDDDDYAPRFKREGTVKVYILAKSLGRRVYALAEDLEPVEEGDRDSY